MFNIIEPSDHSSCQGKIDSLLEFFKIYQNWELSAKNQKKATFIIAEDEARGIYGGAVFFPQKIKELDENLSHLLSILENRTVWCARLCLYAEQDDNFTKLDTLELCENFYVNLYEILSTLGSKKSTNCLPIALRPKDYRNSLTYGDWSYFTKPKPEELLSDYVYVLLALPDYQRQVQAFQEEQADNKRLETPALANTDRPVQ